MARSLIASGLISAATVPRFTISTTASNTAACGACPPSRAPPASAMRRRIRDIIWCRNALNKTATRGEMVRSIQLSMTTRCCAWSTLISPPSSRRSSAVTAVTSWTTIFEVLTFSWKTRYEVVKELAMWLNEEGWIDTDCFCCDKLGLARPGETSSTFGKRPAARTALSSSGESACRLAERRAACLFASPSRRSSGSSPRSARLPQNWSAASPMPTRARSARKWRSQNRLAPPFPSVRFTCIHFWYASTAAKWSDSSRLKQTCAAFASSRLASGCKKGDRSDSAAAIRRIGSAQLKSAP
mmetsp:Transcript_20984/g.69323  ORF Transcript_20984/g.69323 Transcript_20984/m.69323 type:complete len:299 (-) Transcript_20984:2522-3418(-)